jgi:hypothetical protein
MKVFKSKRTLPLAAGLLVLIVIGLGLLGVQLDLWGSAIDSGPATGGNEWLQVPAQGGNEWVRVPIEGANEWLEVPTQGGNEWVLANGVASYQLLAPSYEASFAVQAIADFNRPLGLLTLSIEVQPDQEAHAKWLKDIQNGAEAIHYSLLANDAQGELITAWIIQEASASLEASSNPYTLRLTFRQIQNVNRRG